MIRSMTAFARCSREAQWGVLNWELRAVNHRYLEMNVRMPEELRVIEPAVRNLVNKSLSRGKLECNLRFQPVYDENTSLSVNVVLAKQLAEASREVDHLLYNPSAISSLDVLRWPGVLNPTEIDWEAVQKEALSLLEEGLAELIETRAREGEQLKGLIVKRLDAMAEVVAAVRQKMPDIVAAQRDKLTEKIRDIAEQIDETRLAQEIAILVQKMDVDEEMDRLDTHIQEVRRILQQDKPIGRRLDFLMQELNREANTLGSKSVTTDSTQASVELKVLIEQMREQVQNIE